MGQGILGWIHNNISGGQSRPTPNPGVFETGTVGGSWGDYLKSLYATDTGSSKQFQSQSTALRDALSMEAGGASEKFATATNAGGFYDSGARLAGLSEINRAKMYSYSQGLTAILAKLEEQKLAAAYPFIQSQLGEYNAHQQAVAAAQGEQNFRGAQLGQGISGALGGGGLNAGGGYGGGGGTGTGTTGGYIE